MHTAAQMSVTQNGEAPGNAEGASVATSAANGMETKAMLRAMLDPGAMSRTSPEDWRV